MRWTTFILVALIAMFAFSTGCAALSERQKLAGSALLFSGAVNQVDNLKKSGKMSEVEVKLAVATLKEAEKGIDEWKAALEAYELRINAAMKATIKDALDRVTAMILEAMAKP